MQFCEFSTEMKEGIIEAYQHSFQISDELFDNPYCFFKGCASDLDAHVKYVTPYIPRESIKPKTDDSKFNLDFLSVDYCLGVDLPKPKQQALIGL